MAAFEGSRSSQQQGSKVVLLHQAVPRLMRAVYRDLNDGIALSAAYRAGISSGETEGGSSSSSSSGISGMKGDSKSLTYGEVQVESFMQVLKFVRDLIDRERGVRLGTTAGLTFYDLGCGTGKPVLIAALVGGGGGGNGSGMKRDSSASVGKDKGKGTGKGAGTGTDTGIDTVTGSGSGANVGGWIAKACGIEIIPSLVASGQEAVRRLSHVVAQAPPLEKVKESRVITRGNKVPVRGAMAAAAEDEGAQRAMVSCAVALVTAAPDGCMLAQDVSNALMSQLGKKVYKAGMKGTSSFKRFVEVRGAGVVQMEVMATSAGGQSAVRLAVRRGEVEVEGGAEVAGSGTGAGTGAGGGAGEEEEECPDLVPTPAPWMGLALTTAERAVLLPLADLSVCVGDIFEAPAPGPDGPVRAWWEEGDVIYAASLLFGDAEMALLAERARLLRPGSVVISLKPLPSPPTPPSDDDACAGAGTGTGASSDGGSQDGGGGGDGKQCRLELVEAAFYKMSWAMAKVYFYMVR